MQGLSKIDDSWINVYVDLSHTYMYVDAIYTMYHVDREGHGTATAQIYEYSFLANKLYAAYIQHLG